MSRSSTRAALQGGNFMGMMNILMQLRKVNKAGERESTHMNTYINSDFVMMHLYLFFFFQCCEINV